MYLLRSQKRMEESEMQTGDANDETRKSLNKRVGK